MERRHRGNTAVDTPLASDRHDPVLDVEKTPRRHIAHRDDHLGRERRDLSFQERQALRDLFRLWRTVPRRPALENVRDVDVLACVPHGDDHLVQQLAGLPHEGHARQVLVLARRLADEHDVRLAAASPEDDVRAGLAETAAFAVPEVLLHEFQSDVGVLFAL